MMLLNLYWGFVLFAAVANNILKTNERLTVPVSTAEFAVMRAAFSVCVFLILFFNAN